MTFRSRNAFKGLQEALEAIQDAEDEELPDQLELNIIPPDVDDLTDDEELDENDCAGNGRLPNDVPGAVEVNLASSDDFTESEVKIPDFTEPEVEVPDESLSSPNSDPVDGARASYLRAISQYKKCRTTPKERERENRLSLKTKLKKKKGKKNNRGTSKSYLDKKNALLCVQWVDNSTCTMLTNFDSIMPKGRVSRYDRAAKEKIKVPQPRMFQTYNRLMGGVDLVDQGLNTYRIAVKSKKWYFVIFTYLMDLSMYNAWRLYLVIGDQQCDQLAFRRGIVRHYLKDGRLLSGQTRAGPSMLRRSDLSVCHVPKKMVKQLRCAICHQRVRWQCEQCRTTLCLERECFRVYLPQ